MAWRLNPALTQFRNEVNNRFPNRDKASDGTIGDEAHQATNSDHNPDADGSVDSWDMDVDLRSGNDTAEIEKLKRAFEKHPAGRYWIHNDRIAHRNENWVPKSYAYAGPNRNRHDHHVHWNSNQATENITTPFLVEEDEMTQAEFIQFLIAALQNDTVKAIFRAIPWQYPVTPSKSMLTQQNELASNVEQILKSSVGSTLTLTDEQIQAITSSIIASISPMLEQTVKTALENVTGSIHFDSVE